MALDRQIGSAAVNDGGSSYTPNPVNNLSDNDEDVYEEISEKIKDTSGTAPEAETAAAPIAESTAYYAPAEEPAETDTVTVTRTPAPVKAEPEPAETAAPNPLPITGQEETQASEVQPSPTPVPEQAAVDEGFRSVFSRGARQEEDESELYLPLNPMEAMQYSVQQNNAQVEPYIVQSANPVNTSTPVPEQTASPVQPANPVLSEAQPSYQTTGDPYINAMRSQANTVNAEQAQSGSTAQPANPVNSIEGYRPTEDSYAAAMRNFGSQEYQAFLAQEQLAQQEAQQQYDAAHAVPINNEALQNASDWAARDMAQHMAANGLGADWARSEDGRNWLRNRTTAYYNEAAGPTIAPAFEANSPADQFFTQFSTEIPYNQRVSAANTYNYIYGRLPESWNDARRSSYVQSLFDPQTGNFRFDFTGAMKGWIPDELSVPMVNENGQYNAALDWLTTPIPEYNPDGSVKTDAAGKPVTHLPVNQMGQVLGLFQRPYESGSPIPNAPGAGYRGVTIPSDVERFVASSPFVSYMARETFGDVNRWETVEATKEEWNAALNAFIEANPNLQKLLELGLIDKASIGEFFFKGLKIKDKEEEPKKSGGGGGGSRSSSSGRSSGGGGGSSRYSGSSSSSAPTKDQRMSRIYNIMKNWSF